MAIPTLARFEGIFAFSGRAGRLVRVILFVVFIELFLIIRTISGDAEKLLVLALIGLGNNRQD